MSKMLVLRPVSFIYFCLGIPRLTCVKVWISPVNQNYEGPRSAYGDPYHGYWMADISQLNSRFGTADDLKALSAELHRRNMYASILHLSTPQCHIA